MPDVLYALEIWLLLDALLAWVFSRAAIRLRQPPPSLAEILEAEVYAEEDRPHEPAAAFRPGELRRAVRVYEGA